MKVYRANEPYIEKNASVYDVLLYERDVLGNTLWLVEDVTEDFLRNKEAKHLVWVCKTKKEAMRYGKNILTIVFSEKDRIIGGDADCGFLLLKIS